MLSIGFQGRLISSPPVRMGRLTPVPRHWQTQCKIALWNKAVGNINEIKNDRVPILSAEDYDSAEIWSKIESRLVLGPKSCFDKK